MFTLEMSSWELLPFCPMLRVTWAKPQTPLLPQRPCQERGVTKGPEPAGKGPRPQLTGFAFLWGLYPEFGTGNLVLEGV